MARCGNGGISTIETPSSAHLHVQARVDDVVIQTCLQRGVASDGGEVPRRRLQRQCRRLPRPPHEARQVALDRVAAHVALQRLQQAEAAALGRRGCVGALVKGGLHTRRQICPREGGSIQ